MKEDIINYLVNNSKIPLRVSEEIYNKLSTHPDILEEFCNWLNTGKFVSSEGKVIEVEGYTAVDLVNQTFLKPEGAYTFLISLREKPEEAKKWLNERFDVVIRNQHH